MSLGPVIFDSILLVAKSSWPFLLVFVVIGIVKRIAGKTSQLGK